MGKLLMWMVGVRCIAKKLIKALLGRLQAASYWITIESPQAALYEAACRRLL